MICNIERLNSLEWTGHNGLNGPLYVKFPEFSSTGKSSDSLSYSLLYKSKAKPIGFYSITQIQKQILV